VRDAVSVAEGNTDRRDKASACSALRGLRPWHVGRSLHENREISCLALQLCWSGPVLSNGHSYRDTTNRCDSAVSEVIVADDFKASGTPRRLDRPLARQKHHIGRSEPVEFLYLFN
jgi:hypothetical protein